MIENEKGSVIVTGNTSAHRGKAEFGGTASTKAAQKILTESMARYLNPKGVHVAYITIDAATNSVTLTNSADGATGNRTLAAKGMVTVLYVGSATAFISGAGLS